MEHFEKSSIMPCTSEALYAFHLNPGAFERLNFPWSSAQVVSRTAGVENGSEVFLKIPVAPLIFQTWAFRHEGVIPKKQFQDRAFKGPIRSWFHTHSFSPLGENESALNDAIEYDFQISPPYLKRYVHHMLQRGFEYRHEVTRNSVADHREVLEGGKAPHTILITGSTGLVGSALAAYFSSGGHSVRVLLRKEDASCPYRSFLWDPHKQSIDLQCFEGVDTIIHLSGASIADGRWTNQRKQVLWESRIDSTAFLIESIRDSESLPKTLIVASAIGIYGTTPLKEVDESSEPGSGFLADLVGAWEKATIPAKELGIRTVNARFGVVLDPRGGILKKLLPLFRLGLGGPVGDGTHYLSWISMEDLLSSMSTLVESPIEGGVNIVSPSSCTYNDFVAALSSVLHRPRLLRVPRKAITTLFGEMGEETVFSNQRAVPSILHSIGFKFRYPDVGSALSMSLGSPSCGY
jgi:uncharacterized protein